MESEKANVDYQIQMQQECVELKDTEMKKMREQIEQVTLVNRAFGLAVVEQKLLTMFLLEPMFHECAPSVVFRSSAWCLRTSALRSAWKPSESMSRSI